jgi:putative membrane protein
MRRIAVATWLAGVGLLLALFVGADINAALGAVTAIKWGLGLILAYHILPVLADSIGWRSLFGAQPPSLALLYGCRWIAEAGNSLLPAAQVGGEFVRGRLARLAGIEGPVAWASVIVDVTMGVASQGVFTLIGIALLLLLHQGGDLADALALGLGLMALAALAFYLVQRAGLFGAAAHALTHRLQPPGWRPDIASAQALDQAIDAIYRKRRCVARGTVWRLAGWLTSAGEVWLVLLLLGHPVGWPEAIIFESLSQAVRTAAFAIPGGLGVQEGTLLLLAQPLGIPAEAALALSLVKRLREILLGLPALLVWQTVEARLRLRTARVRVG